MITITEENTKQLYNKLDNYYQQSADKPEIWERIFTTDEICFFRDDCERVAVLFYQDDSIDSSFADDLRDGLQTGEEEMLTMEEANQMLSHWIEMIEQRFIDENETLEMI